MNWKQKLKEGQSLKGVDGNKEYDIDRDGVLNLQLSRPTAKYDHYIVDGEKVTAEEMIAFAQTDEGKLITRQPVKVITRFDDEVYLDDVVSLMDKEIIEMLHIRLAPCTAQLFLSEYEKEHHKKYNEYWVLGDY